MNYITPKIAKEVGEDLGRIVEWLRLNTNFWVGIWPALFICFITIFILVPGFMFFYFIEVIFTKASKLI